MSDAGRWRARAAARRPDRGNPEPDAAAGTQVLVATSTLAWGVNTPAHLVVIKGTEFFDAPTR
jgi:replicative superfamily II helicase